MVIPPGREERHGDGIAREQRRILGPGSAEDRIDGAPLAAGQLDREPDRHRVRRGEESLRLEGPRLAVAAGIGAVPLRAESVVDIVPQVRAGKPRDRGLVDAHQGRKTGDRKSTRLNSSHTVISYAVFCLKKKKK